MTDPDYDQAERGANRGGNVDLAEIRTHDDLASMRAHNQSLPISRLNAEVLKHIFLFVKPDDLETPATKWFQFSHVCVYWRRVALDFPFLWSTIFLEMSLAANETLSLRSGSTALSIVSGAILPPRGHNYVEQVSVIRSCAARIKSIQLHDSVPGLGTLLGHLDMSLPKLETVSIKLIFDDVVLSGPLFSGTAPNLVSLSLTLLYIPNGLEALALDLLRLRELRLIGLYGPCPTLPALPALELFVWRPRESQSQEDINAPTGAWPCLRRLELTTSYTSAARFLVPLQIPASAHIALECEITMDGESSRAAAAVLRDALGALGSLAFRADLFIEDKHNLNLRLRSVGETQSDNGAFSLHLRSPSQLVHILPLLTALPARHVLITSLCLPFTVHDSAALAAVLLAETRTLGLRGLFCGKLVAALVDRRALMLESLVLAGMQVKTRRAGIGKAVVAFEDLLQFAQDHLAPRGMLENISFVNCSAESDSKRLEWVDSLSQLVQTEWV